MYKKIYIHLKHNVDECRIIYFLYVYIINNSLLFLVNLINLVSLHTYLWIKETIIGFR